MNWFLRLLAENTITLQQGQAHDRRNHLVQWKLATIAELLTNAGIHKADIWIATSSAITFSHNIPPELHQKLRNIIAA